MITEVHVSVLDVTKDKYREVLRLNAEDGVDIERKGHDLAASYLHDRYPRLWLYRYGTLRDGVTTETPGVMLAYQFAHDADGKMIRSGKGWLHTDEAYIDGVTDMSLIADSGFNGQFQWRDGGAGELAPATVSTVDPEREARYEAAREQARIEADAALEAMNARVALLPPFQVVAGKAQEYADWMANQREDGYSGAAVNYGERWAILMQAQLGDGYTPEYLGDLAERTSHEADLEGVTGNMYGWAVNMLARYWVHGEALRRWHNHEYGHDGDGVVNPAVITIQVPDAAE